MDFETKGIAVAFGALLDSNKTLDSIEVKAETTCRPRLISVLKDGKTVSQQAHVGRNAFVAMMEHVTAATYVKVLTIVVIPSMLLSVWHIVRW